FAFAQIPVTVNGGDGDDVVRVTPTSKNLDLAQGAVTVRGDRGNDRLEIHDESNATQAIYAFADGLLTHQLTRTTAAATAVVGYLEVETLTLNAQAKDPNAGAPLPLPISPFSLDPATHVLTIHGGTLDDHIKVSRTVGQFGMVTAEVNGVSYAIQGSQVTRIEVYGGAGNDLIDVESVFVNPVTVNGGDGDDLIRVAPAAKDLGVIAVGLTVRGGKGFDRLEINDQSDAADAGYSFGDRLL